MRRLRQERDMHRLSFRSVLYPPNPKKEKGRRKEKGEVMSRRTRRASQRLATDMRRSRAALNRPHQNASAKMFAPAYCAVLGYHRPERDVTNGTVVCVDCRRELDGNNQPI